MARPPRRPSTRKTDAPRDAVADIPLVAKLADSGLRWGSACGVMHLRGLVGEMSAYAGSHARTEFTLLALYESRPLIPVDFVRRDFFPHLTIAQFVRNINEGKIRLPLTRIDGSNKAAKFVAVEHLAEYLDVQTAAAKKEADQLATARIVA